MDNSANNSDNNDGAGLPIWAIILLAVIGFLLVALAALVIFMLRRRRSRLVKSEAVPGMADPADGENQLFQEGTPSAGPTAQNGDNRNGPNHSNNYNGNHNHDGRNDSGTNYDGRFNLPDSGYTYEFNNNGPSNGDDWDPTPGYAPNASLMYGATAGRAPYNGNGSNSGHYPPDGRQGGPYSGPYGGGAGGRHGGRYGGAGGRYGGDGDGRYERRVIGPGGRGGGNAWSGQQGGAWAAPGGGRNGADGPGGPGGSGGSGSGGSGGGGMWRSRNAVAPSGDGTGNDGGRRRSANAPSGSDNSGTAGQNDAQRVVSHERVWRPAGVQPWAMQAPPPPRPPGVRSGPQPVGEDTDHSDPRALRRPPSARNWFVRLISGDFGGMWASPRPGAGPPPSPHATADSISPLHEVTARRGAARPGWLHFWGRWSNSGAASDSREQQQRHTYADEVPESVRLTRRPNGQDAGAAAQPPPPLPSLILDHHEEVRAARIMEEALEGVEEDEGEGQDPDAWERQEAEHCHELRDGGTPPPPPLQPGLRASRLRQSTSGRSSRGGSRGNSASGGSSPPGQGQQGSPGSPARTVSEAGSSGAAEGDAVITVYPTPALQMQLRRPRRSSPSLLSPGVVAPENLSDAVKARASQNGASPAAGSSKKWPRPSRVWSNDGKPTAGAHRSSPKLSEPGMAAAAAGSPTAHRITVGGGDGAAHDQGLRPGSSGSKVSCSGSNEPAILEEGDDDEAAQVVEDEGPHRCSPSFALQLQQPHHQQGLQRQQQQRHRYHGHDQCEGLQHHDGNGAVPCADDGASDCGMSTYPPPAGRSGPPLYALPPGIGRPPTTASSHTTTDSASTTLSLLAPNGGATRYVSPPKPKNRSPHVSSSGAEMLPREVYNYSCGMHPAWAPLPKEPPSPPAKTVPEDHWPDERQRRERAQAAQPPQPEQPSKEQRRAAPARLPPLPGLPHNAVTPPQQQQPPARRQSQPSGSPPRRQSQPGVASPRRQSQPGGSSPSPRKMRRGRTFALPDLPSESCSTPWVPPDAVSAPPPIVPLGASMYEGEDLGQAPRWVPSGTTRHMRVTISSSGADFESEPATMRWLPPDSASPMRAQPRVSLGGGGGVNVSWEQQLRDSSPGLKWVPAPPVSPRPLPVLGGGGDGSSFANWGAQLRGGRSPGPEARLPSGRRPPPTAEKRWK